MFSTPRTRFGVSGALLIAALLGLSACLPSSAIAGTASGWVPAFSFQTTESVSGTLERASGIAVDPSSGSIYIGDRPSNSSGESEFRLEKFDSSGEPASFSSTGESSLPIDIEPKQGTSLLVAVDGYGPNKGQIYVLGIEPPGIEVSQSRVLEAYSPAGNQLWRIDTGLENACGLTIDAQGHPWIGRNEGFGEAALEFSATGSPPSKIGSLAGFPSEISPCELGFNSAGEVYANGAGAREYEGTIIANALERFESEEWRVVDTTYLSSFAIDQSSSSGHVFTLSGSLPHIMEFSPSNTLLASGGEGELGGARRIAYYKSTNRIYALSEREVIALRFASGKVPDVTMESAVPLDATSARFEGRVNPVGVNSSWHFEWKLPFQSWSEAQSSAPQTLPSDEAEHEVSFEATELSEGEVYEVRLVASNTDLGLKATSGVKTFSSNPTRITTMPASSTADTSARLNARIDPGGNPSTYSFEYSMGEGAWTQLPQHSAPETTAGVVVSEELTDLEPGTSYRYRVNAEGPLGPASPQGVEVAFTTRTSSEMTPPQRGFELVNSPDKGNQNIQLSSSGEPVMSADGERALWSVAGGAPGGQSGTGNTFLAKRTPNGWISKVVNPPAEKQIGEGAFGYSITHVNSALDRFVGLASPGDGSGSMLRLDDNQEQEVLTVFETGTSSFANNGYVEITEDASHVFVLDADTGMLEDIGSGNREVVGLMPDDEPPECGLDSEGASFAGPSPSRQGAGFNWRAGYRRIARTDGSRVYFEAKANGECGAAYGLYERNRETEKTTLIDSAEPHLISVTRNGREAYFTTQSQLDPEDHNNDNDVYLWEEEDDRSTCLTCVVADARVSNAPVLVSDDFSHIYFESGEKLTPDAVPGAVNLYALQNEQIRFVAATGVDLGSAGTAALSANGRTLLLRLPASSSLTSDAIASECASPRGGQGTCNELYKYDDLDGSFECLSCLRGRETTRSMGSPSESENTNFQVSGDGETVVFTTSQALVTADVNNDTDIYEWHDGALQLLTNGVDKFGTSQAAPQVYAIEAGGRDVLLSFVDSGLTGFERDGLANAYDARIGGGFAVPNPPAHCSEESCQGPLQAAPVTGRPGSSSLIGAGNEGKTGTTARCAGKRKKARRRCSAHRHSKPRHEHHRHSKHRKGN